MEFFDENFRNLEKGDIKLTIFFNKNTEIVRELVEKISKESLNYEKVIKGDGNEDANILVSRAKKEYEKWILPKIQILIEQYKLLAYVAKITGENNLHIDRCQIHRYFKGAFLGKHTDTFQRKDYLYSVIIGLEGDYTGGEFIIYKEKQEKKFSIKKNDVLIMASGYPHSVEPISSGERNTLIFFLCPKLSI